jgi:hypothetical protein
VTLSVPVAALAPVHAPLAVQVVPAFEDQVNVEPAPSTIDVGCAEIDTAGGFMPPLLPPPPP